MIYNAIDVAKYVINYSIQNESPVSNLKLQKLLYYIQAAFLIERHDSCFKGEIKHWRHGPVVPEVYSRYKIYFNEDIIDIQEGISISDNDKCLIEKVVSSYKFMEPWEMVQKTHQEEPWVKTEPNEVIEVNSIEEYFKQNVSKIYGGK